MDEALARRCHAVLSQAIELEEPEREAFLAEACVGDPLLRERLSRLLAAMSRSQDFLETPALTRLPKPESASVRRLHKTIGGYGVVRVIGVGGMATVYEAIQERPHRRVALKVMRHGLVHTSAVNRFKYETEVLARIQHPGIVQIFEAGAWDDGHGVSIPFFAMEFISDARTMTDYACERGLSFDDRLRMFATVCDAVQHGHQHGVIHRDLKPGNVLVDPTGRPRVIDFGVARSIDAGKEWFTPQTSHGQLIGTLNYMSPEQCCGNGEVDIRSDVYSLGVMLYELVCGRLPHDLARVPVPEALRIVRDDLPDRPSALDPRLRGDLDAILMMAMDKDPDRRYPTVAALAADIRRYLANETIEARPPTMIHQCRLFIRRHRAMVATVSLLLLAIVGGAVVSASLAYRATRESERRRIAEAQALSERDVARWQSYVANIVGAFSALQANEFLQLRTRLALASEEHRGWEWRFLAGQAERSERTIAAHDDMIFAFAASLDGTRVATGSRDGSLRIWDVPGGGRVADLEGTPGAPILSVAFRPDGQQVVSGSEDGSVRVWDIATGRQACRLGEHDARIECVAFGRNAIASVSADGILRLWNTDFGESRRILEDQPGGVHGIVFSSDGAHTITWDQGGALWLRDAETLQVEQRFEFPGDIQCVAISNEGARIAAGGSEGRIVVWSAESGKTLHELITPTGVSTVRSLAFSTRGDRLAAGQIHRGITLWDVAEGKLIGALRGHEEAVSGLSFSRDDERLFSASWDRTVRVWCVGSHGSTAAFTGLTGHEDHILAMSFSPDGTVLASGGRDKTVLFWDPELGSLLGALRGHTGHIYGLAFSPDGDWIASASVDRTVRLWSARTGELLATLEGSTGAVWSVAFSPDGRRLASAGDDMSIRIWNVQSRTPIHELTGHTQRVIRVAFSPDGATLASTSRDETVRLWDANSGKLLRVFAGHESDVFAVLFSRDGRRLYSGSRDQTVRVWDIESGACLHTLGGHGQFVTSLSMSPDDKRLAAGTWFGEILLWDLATHDLLATFKAHEQPVRAVAFSPCGRWLATSSYDRTIRLLDASPAEGRLLARSVAMAKRDAARSALDRLVADKLDPAHLADAVEDHPALDPETRVWARKLILAKSLSNAH